MTPVAALPVAVPADATARLDFPVRAPADATPGDWWLLVKLAAAGRIGYTDSIRLLVLPPGSRR